MSAVSLDAARWAASAVVLLDIGEYSVHAAALESRVDGDQPPWATSQPLPCIQPRCAGLALESLVARSRRSRCFAAIVGCSCYPRLGSRHKWHCHRLHRAFATLPRTRLITPFHRRGNHFKHFVCQGCNGRLFSGCLFALSSRGQSDPAFGTPGEDHQHQDSRDRSGPRFHATGDVRQSPKPLDFLRVFLILNLSL